LGALVHDMTQQMSTLVRDEIRLAQAEMTQKGKKAGIGAGLFGGAGLVALYGVAALEAIQGFKQDVATVKGEHRHEHV
jgi:ferric-dicitrate binding protein FerR (iron transport regulator)